jgi:acetylornithine deacetylase/succinyl-diaminopimelate desuccinylase-like protein
VIPCEAIAKISMRLVPGQNPARAFAAVREHLENRVPRGMKLEISELTGEAAGFRLPLSSPLFRLAGDVLGEMDDRGAVFYWNGASIPIVSALREVSGAAPLIVGWGQSQDRIHSPNESFSLAQFSKAKEWAVKILGSLA